MGLTLYGMLVAVLTFAPIGERVPLPCGGEVLRSQSVVYCALMRNFVTPEMKDVAEDAAARVAAEFPGTVTLTLDGNLPFGEGVPLIPHLSHDDGEKLDFAYYFTDAEGRYLPGKTRSWIGYWAFETDGTDCPAAGGWSMRWDMGWLQGLWPDRRLDEARTRALILALAGDPRVSKIFVEPSLARRLQVSGPKIRFQGCRAARHDDHIHVEL